MFRMLSMIAILILAGAAAAQINHPYNEVGIYTVEHPVGVAQTEIEAPANIMFDCYIVLTNPYNETLGRPITTVGGFEFSLGIPADVYLLGVSSFRRLSAFRLFRISRWGVNCPSSTISARWRP